MDKTTINFNGVDIVVANKDGKAFLPIKPICEAIGIAFQSQNDKIKEHPILRSVVTIIVTTGADGKKYEMVCLPVKYVYGWLFTINPGKVAPDARENVERYSRECYEVLYNHFHNTLDRQLKANEAEIRLLNELNAAITAERDAKTHRRKIEESLGKLRSERLNPQPQLDLQ